MLIEMTFVVKSAKGCLAVYFFIALYLFLEEAPICYQFGGGGLTVLEEEVPFCWQFEEVPFYRVNLGGWWSFLIMSKTMLALAVGWSFTSWSKTSFLDQVIFGEA